MTTITVSKDLFQRMAGIIDSVVNAEECLCEEMVAGKCLYCQASAVQDEVVSVISEVTA